MFDQLENTINEVNQLEDLSADKTGSSPESSKEHNFRVLRERVEQADRRAQDAERKAQELERLLQSQKPESMTILEDESDDFSFDDESYIEGKQFKKYIAPLKKELRETKKRLDEVNYYASQSSA